jgi:hypothetical protein
LGEEYRSFSSSFTAYGTKRYFYSLILFWHSPLLCHKPRRYILQQFL